MGHPTAHPSASSAAARSGRRPGTRLARFVLQHPAQDGPAGRIGDGAVESTHASTPAVRPAGGVSAVRVRFPFARRPGAWPARGDLYRSAERDWLNQFREGMLEARGRTLELTAAAPGDRGGRTRTPSPAAGLSNKARS